MLSLCVSAFTVLHNVHYKKLLADNSALAERTFCKCMIFSQPHPGHENQICPVPALPLPQPQPAPACMKANPSFLPEPCPGMQQSVQCCMLCRPRHPLTPCQPVTVCQVMSPSHATSQPLSTSDHNWPPLLHGARLRSRLLNSSVMGTLRMLIPG